MSKRYAIYDDHIEDTKDGKHMYQGDVLSKLNLLDEKNRELENTCMRKEKCLNRTRKERNSYREVASDRFKRIAELNGQVDKLTERVEAFDTHQETIIRALKHSVNSLAGSRQADRCKEALKLLQGDGE